MADRVSTPETFVPESLRDLSPFPSVALRAMELLTNEAVETTALVRIISPDPVFVAGLLYCANSALFGLESQIRTVRHAIVILGRERLKGVVLTTALRSYLKDQLRSPHGAAWWRHSLATALLSEAIAGAGSCHYPAAYTAGLLHDIGRLALLTCVNEKLYREFLRTVENTSLSVTECERECYGTDHCEIGEVLLKQWRLPEDLGIAAKHHHDPGRWKAIRWLGVVGGACAVSSMLGFEALKRPQTPLSDEILTSLPGVLRSQLLISPEAIQSALMERIDSLHGVPRSSDRRAPASADR